MVTINHDAIGIRLSIILGRLLEGETLSLAHLATEFNVSQKTIRRDLGQRLAHLDIERVQVGQYRLSSMALGARRTDSDIMRFAKITHISGLFPSFDRKFISTLLTNHTESPFVIYTQPLREKLNTFSGFHVITEAIINHKSVDFNSEGKVILKFEPYRFIYFQRDWYLVGKYKGKLAVFAYTNISNPKINDQLFAKEDKFLQLTCDEQFICALPHFQYLAALYNELLHHE